MQYNQAPYFGALRLEFDQQISWSVLMFSVLHEKICRHLNSFKKNMQFRRTLSLYSELYPQIQIQMVHDLWWFDFKMVWKRHAFSRNYTSEFEFCSFPQLAQCSHNVGQLQWATTCSQPQDHKGKQLTHRTACVAKLGCAGGWVD
jgi:hypothetical protein